MHTKRQTATVVAAKQAKIQATLPWFLTDTMATKVQHDKVQKDYHEDVPLVAWTSSADNFRLGRPAQLRKRTRIPPFQHSDGSLFVGRVIIQAARPYRI